MRTPLAKNIAIASNRPGFSANGANKLITTMAGSPAYLLRIAAHPVGASLCLALGYMVLCSAYIILLGRVTARESWSIEQLHKLELLKGLVLMLVTGVGYFAFASYLLKRIAAQQHYLTLLFQSVSDGIFLLQVEADESYRFLCVNMSFLNMTGLSEEQVVGKQIDEVLPGTSLALVRKKYHAAILGHKTVSWDESTSYPAGIRVGEVTVTPLANKAGKVDQLAGVIRDVTERKLAAEEGEAYSRKLQVLSRRLVEVQETERRHIARELHDEIGQALTVMQLNLQVMLESPYADGLTLRLNENLKVIERLLEQVQDISLNLRPSILDDLGLQPALHWYTGRQAALLELKIGFQSDPLDQRLDPVIETECFRVAQEALTNVARHAQAKAVTVELRREDGQLHLRVRDDGVGFDVAATREKAVRGASLGLLSMEERASLAGGRLEFNSIRGRGTEVHAWFPLKWQVPTPEFATHEPLDQTDSRPAGR